MGTLIQIHEVSVSVRSIVFPREQEKMNYSTSKS